ncbi:hypothetical protein [Caloranaerobacter sp. DY30410]|uniref:hypothetical protein n=1 Tax=Caloranaerobacter sp. DY30410 TaxID=3238305 RepID=UPI003D07D2F6
MGFRHRFCNARSGNEKGYVERGVEYIRRKVFSREEAFGSIEEANKYLQERLIKEKRVKVSIRSNKRIITDKKKYCQYRQYQKHYSK